MPPRRPPLFILNLSQRDNTKYQTMRNVNSRNFWRQCSKFMAYRQLLRPPRRQTSLKIREKKSFFMQKYFSMDLFSLETMRENQSYSRLGLLFKGPGRHCELNMKFLLGSQFLSLLYLFYYGHREMEPRLSSQESRFRRIILSLPPPQHGCAPRLSPCTGHHRRIL